MADCPFCGYHNHVYAVQLHIEEHHAEETPDVEHADAVAAQTATVPSDDNNSSPSSMPPEWLRCTREGCGEFIPLTAIDEHLDLHVAVALAEEEDRPPLPPRRGTSKQDALPHKVQSSSGKSDSRKASEPPIIESSFRRKENGRSSPSDKNRDGSILSYFSGNSSNGIRRPPPSLRRLLEPRTSGRLGKRELGPYAFERSMPAEIRRRLVEDTQPREANRIDRNGNLVREIYVPNETNGLIPVLADLFALEEFTTATYFCHPSTKHIRKVQCDGDFCGYWSTQMVLSYIQHVDQDGPQNHPNVLKMQNLIEQAWDRGIGSHGRVETGGIINTRKWIGTHEALAFLTQIGVGADALAFEDSKDRTGNTAVGDLLDHVEAYFMSDSNATIHGSSHITQLPPIFFQRLGHSMTIIGLERQVDGTRNLLVFDSSHATSEPMKRLVANQRAHSSVRRLLDPYRRSDSSLSKWKEFEIIV
jgi:hypothetical protein